MAKVIKRVFDVVLVLIIILLIVYFALRNIGILEIYEVETGSMEQGIHAGDYVLICEQDKYVVGDIVTYRKNDYFITHRIVKRVMGDKVITKGDANNAEDEEIDISSIEGKVIYNGGLLNFVIDYKFAVASFLLGLYLLSCYFGKGDNSKNIKQEGDAFGDVLVNTNNVLLSRKRIKKRIRPEYRSR